MIGIVFENVFYISKLLKTAWSRAETSNKSREDNISSTSKCSKN